MDYHLEKLGDERFQKLCQTILATSYPSVVCLPVGQPDGGRDAIVKELGDENKIEHIIFQVKFAKNPDSKDERDFIEKLISGEAEKVKKLKAKGATKYFLMTNVSGTSHLDTGSIDKVNLELTKALEIDAYCWWRDDLERRIDANSSIKWSFPEILKATDLLETLLPNKLSSGATPKTDVIKAYMAHQAHQDAQLKFKQIEFQKGIIEQFVDTPVKFSSALTEDQQNIQNFLVEQLPNNQEENIFSDADLISEEDGAEIFGALQLMINPYFSKFINGAVLEGAPGQGKSTIAQFLCQINRFMLLGRTEELKKIERQYVPSEARIPFKVDLRDYATWLSGRDPFSEEQAEQPLGQRSPLLEVFIAAQVQRYTGASFTVEDLTTISKSSQLLIVLDGFDEVAEIKTRNKIVSEVSEAAIRINENALSSQIIVTSRPTAFANSPGFSRNEWQHINMLPLSRKVIDIYAEKWLDGRSIEQGEKTEILSVLAEKLEQSHVRDLARNPMQLAILLALISVQGASLPDKRTALYDNYINIFLNRESEKSKIVRDHRELLVNIHRYLAWVLQSEAEEESQAGNIGEARLREILKAFLESAGHDSKLVDELFSGMVERVVALVSRVQGTFEFEVQPLREYFAARHLYDTAPYSPSGNTCSGTLPDRFSSIARNFYWLNVTRFYAGCYSSGELSSLIDGLDELSESGEYRFVGQPSRLGILLLKDYVFNQSPKLAVRLINKITQNLGFRALISGMWTHRSDDGDLSLPPGSSRDVLIKKCFSMINSTSKFDEIYTASRIITQNCSPEEIHSIWSKLRLKTQDTPLIINSGSALGIFEKITLTETKELIEDHGTSTLLSILRHHRLDLIEGEDSTISDIFIQTVLTTNGSFLFFNKSPLSLTPKVLSAYCLATISSGYFLSNLRRMPPDRNIRSIFSSNAFRGHLLSLENYNDNKKTSSTDETQNYSKILEATITLYNSKASEVKQNINLWESLIESIRTTWGDCANLNCIAIQACDMLNEGNTTHHSSKGAPTLITKTLLIKKQINNTQWLLTKLSEDTHTAEDLDILLRCIFKWSSLKTLSLCAEQLSSTLEKLPTDRWELLTSRLNFHNYQEEDESLTISDMEQNTLPASISARLAGILLSIVPINFRLLIRDLYLLSYDGKDHFILEGNCNTICSASWTEPSHWDAALKAIRDCYTENLIFHLDATWMHEEEISLPTNVALTICENPNSYPIGVLSIAELSLLAAIGNDITPVGKTAKEDDWFHADR